MRDLNLNNARKTDRSDPSIGRYLSDLKKEGRVTIEEEIDLGFRIKNNDQEAIHKLVKANLLFVVSVAKQYEKLGLSLSDLINEGNIGLIKAAKEFDPTRGNKFTSFAVWEIRQAIIIAINKNSRLIRISGNQIKFMRKVNDIENLLSHELFRKPTEEEIIPYLRDSFPFVKKDEQFFEFFRRNNVFAFSFDKPINDENDTLCTLFQDVNSPNPEVSVIDDSCSTDIKRLLNFLKPKDAEIIKMHLGFGCFPMSFFEIARTKKFNIGESAIQKRYQKSIKTLKTFVKSKSSMFKEYCN